MEQREEGQEEEQGRRRADKWKYLTSSCLSGVKVSSLPPLRGCCRLSQWVFLSFFISGFPSGKLSNCLLLYIFVLLKCRDSEALLSSSVLSESPKIVYGLQEMAALEDVEARIIQIIKLWPFFPPLASVSLYLDPVSLLVGGTGEFLGDVVEWRTQNTSRRAFSCFFETSYTPLIVLLS